MNKWHRRFMELAHVVSGWSKDPTTRVGAVLVKDNHVISTGYNGLPPGFDDSLVHLSREFKVKHTIHAERNAIDHARRPVSGSVMYVTAPPCSACADYMAEKGIAVVYMEEIDEAFKERWNFEDSLAVLSNNNIPLITLTKEDHHG